jgi:hypothetical protein
VAGELAPVGALGFELGFGSFGAGSFGVGEGALGFELGGVAFAEWSIPGFMHTWFCVTQLRQVALL